MLAPGDYHLGVWIGHAVADDETFVHRDVLVLRVWPEAGDRASEIERARILQPPVTWDMGAA
jgi:hypothetical protein